MPITVDKQNQFLTWPFLQKVIAFYKTTIIDLVAQKDLFDRKWKVRVFVQFGL